MSIQTFDWQGYMSDIGYAPEEIPNEINDEDREWLYGLWARDLMEQLNYEARQNPFLATAEEKRNNARDRFLQYAPDLAHVFNVGQAAQADPDKTFDAEEFRQHVIDNPVQNADLGYYLDTFATTRINPDTKYVRPWLDGLSKDQFKRSFMEQQGIDEAWTSVDDIRNGNFGTLAAAYEAQQAQEAPPKSGHMAAFKQGWYEFEKLFGYTIGTLGDAVGINWLSDIGNEIAENVIKKSDAYNYQSKYNQSLADTIKNEGVMAGAGKILNMAEENWATTAAPLALAAIGKILSTYAHIPQPLANAATNAVAANLVRRQGRTLLRRASQLAYGSSAALSGLEIGGVRAELEEHDKYDPDNVADVVAAGLVSSSLDFIGNVAAFKGITITARRLFQSKITTDIARANLAREIAEDQAKSFTHRVLSAALIEGVTEGLQEIPAMVVGARRGIDYTEKEVRDRIIDAAAVGAFMGGGVRTAEIMMEKHYRDDTEEPSDLPEDTQDTQDTPQAPQPPPQPNPPGFEGQIPTNLIWEQTENGFAVSDNFNTGYGASREEAVRDYIKQANKGRVDIDANDISVIPASSQEGASSIVRYGDRGQNTIRVTGQGRNQVIRRIIEFHNDPNNVVNLQGDNVFDADILEGLSGDDFRSRLEERKTGYGFDADTIANRENSVDIPVKFDAVSRTDIPGTYAEFNLDESTRDALRSKDFVILSNPRKKNAGRGQEMILYRDGFIYTVSLENNANDERVVARVEAESIKDIVRRKRTNPKSKDAQDKARKKNVANLPLEREIGTQNLRIVETDILMNTTTSRVNKNAVTIAPVPRPGFIEIERRRNAEGEQVFDIDPREILKARVTRSGGKIEKVGKRGITYTSNGQTTRLDITADGRVLVSRDGRFIGDYAFNASDIGGGIERAILQSTRIEANQLFNVIDVPENLRYDNRAIFVYEGLPTTTPDVSRNYYAIKGNGDVEFIPNTDNNYIKRLLALPHIQTLDHARDVFTNQFIEFWAQPVRNQNGDIVGYKDNQTGTTIYETNLTVDSAERFSNSEVDNLFSRGYQGDFVKVWAVTNPDGTVVRATTEEGIESFINDIKNYANILDDSQWNPSSRGESIFSDAYTEEGRYRSEDLYGVNYDDLFTNLSNEEDFNDNSDKIRSAIEKIISNIENDIKALDTRSGKGKVVYHISKKRVDEYKSLVERLRNSLNFFNSVSSANVSSYYSGGARQFNEEVRRLFYRLRTAQAMLRIDLYRNKLSSLTNSLNRTELDRILKDDIGNYDGSLSIEQLRRRTIQAEAIALRLEEAFVDVIRTQTPTSINNLLWEAIYPNSTQDKYGSFVDRIHSEGTDLRFSRNTQAPRIRRRRDILSELNDDNVIGTFTLNEMVEKGLRGESGGLRILATQEEAHEIERMFTTSATQPYFDDDGLIQGFVAPDGIIYLVEDGIVDGKVRHVILHEYGVHAKKFGMSDGEFQEIIQGIKAKRNEQSPDGDFIRKCITRAKEANPMLTEDSSLFWEEVAAYSVEMGYDVADTSIFGRLQAWIKRWLWEFGVIDASTLHYQDLVIFAQGMLNKSGPLKFFDGTHDYTKQQDINKNITQFSRSILAEDTPEREEFAQRTYRRLRGLDDAIERERNGEDADSIEQATDWRRNDNGNWNFDPTAWEPRGVQKQAGVNYPNMGEEISNFRYSIGVKAREEYRAQLEEGRKDFSPEQIENVLKELDKYHDAKQYKKVKAALHWVITGRIRLPEDEEKVNEAIAVSENAKVDLISNLKKYESPLDFIEEYKEYKPKAPAINPDTVSEFSDPVNLGDGIVTYLVQDNKEGQQAMREIINTHWGDNANPWCLLQGDGKGNLIENSWRTWEHYNGLPKRVAFKNGKLLSFMATERGTSIKEALQEIIDSVGHAPSGNQHVLDSFNNPIVYDFLSVDGVVSSFDKYIFDLEYTSNPIIVDWQDDPALFYAYKFFDIKIRSEIEEEDHINLRAHTDEWLNAIKSARNEYMRQNEEVYERYSKWLENDAFKISYINENTAIIVDENGNRVAQPMWMEHVDVTKEFYLDEKGVYRSLPREQWWDRKDESHPNLDWARGDQTEKIKYSRVASTRAATAEDLKPYSSFINSLENDLVSQRISGVPREGDTVLYQRGDVNEFITRDSLYTVEDAADYHPDLEQRWIDYHRDDSESNFVRYSRSIPEADLVQRFTSQRTSLPQNDPALYKNKWFLKELKEGSENFDIGAGITTKPTERLASLGVRNVPFDPFNREQSENAQAIQDIANGKRYPTVTVANVLNVIAEPESRSNVILQAAKALDENGKAFFDVYVAPREGETSIGTYQTAMRPEEYLPEIERWFNDIERHGSVIIASSPKEEVNTTEAVWWDANPQVRGNIIRFSLATTTSTPEDSLPQTPKQRGTAIPNAPGVYRMPDGSLHIEPSELPVGFENETILYAAISVSDPAKNERRIAELRDAIVANDDLLQATDQIMEGRGDTNEDHRLGYAVSLILDGYDPASDLYQLTVDAFHEAVSKATGGAYQNLVLNTSQIEAAAHAMAGIPYEPIQTAPQETVPTPRPNAAEVREQRMWEGFDASDAQRADMTIANDGTISFSSPDSSVDVVFEQKARTPFDASNILDKVYITTSQHGEANDLYNHLADSPIYGTQEPTDTGDFALPADQYRARVESFLATVIPNHIWERTEILWDDNAENNAALGGALGVFRPRAYKNKNIIIRGWGRTFGQVVRTAAREASRFGWGLWQNNDFRKALVDFYDMFTSQIHNELVPYYNERGITDPTRLSDEDKIFMVQTFFSKLNQSLFTDDVTDMGDVLGITRSEYKRILDRVKSGMSAQEADLTRYMEGLGTDSDLAKSFAQEMLRMTMETSIQRGTQFIYERNSLLGGKDRIRVSINEWGTYRRKIPDTRFGKAAEQIRKNLIWWNRRHNERGEKFARFMMRNFPMSFWPMKWLHLYVPDARLGDTTIGRATQMISRVWQRISDLSGTTIARDYALMETIHGILRKHGYDPTICDDMQNQTYRQFFQSLGITSQKDLDKADLADQVVSGAEQLKKEGAANIRQAIMETGISLYNRMLNEGFSQEAVERMVSRFEAKRAMFRDDYSHRHYEAFTDEGKKELVKMLHYLEREPYMGKSMLWEKVRKAREDLDRARARHNTANAAYYRETTEARRILRRWERLEHLWTAEQGFITERNKSLTGAALHEQVLNAMKNTIRTIVSDRSVGKFDAQGVPHYNTIAGQKARILNPDNFLHKHLMDFLGEIKDPIMSAVYSLDQQRQILAKLNFNKELGEYLLDNDMADLRGQPNAQGIATDLSEMEYGSFLEYINVLPDFMVEIKNEYENMKKVTETILGGVTDMVKANSTIYSLRLAVNNYVGNTSMLLASGHIFRIGNWLTATDVVRKQFLDRFMYGAKDPSDFAKKIIEEMRTNMVTGGSGTELSAFQYHSGAHENFIRGFTDFLYGFHLLNRSGKSSIDHFAQKALEMARNFYTFGDEWVKPLIYLNNRANAIAKYQALTIRRNGETNEEYQERVMKKAIEEAAEQTIRETVSWENSPFFVRQLSTKSARFFTPDFLLHNFQMLRITASNYVRIGNIISELRNAYNPATQMNAGERDAYISALKKELVQRGIGGSITAGVYAGLAGATGSVMAYIPYMMNSLLSALDGEDDKDKDNTFFNPQEWEGAQRILNYKTGGDNFFVPLFKKDGKLYAWNYGRASVMLTHSMVRPPTENPEFTDYASIFFKNIVNLSNGTIAQEILNNTMGKDKWGREIGMMEGWTRIAERAMVPGAARQILDMTVGYPGYENPHREGKLIKMSDLGGIVVNAYDMKDIVNELAWDMSRVESNSQNLARRTFVKRLSDSDALSDEQALSLVDDMRESNARDFDKANYLLIGLRQMGMENKEIAHWLTTSRKDGQRIVAKEQVGRFLKGQNVYDTSTLTYLKNKRKTLARGQSDVKMSKEELATVLQNYDKAIRIYSQALRAQ